LEFVLFNVILTKCVNITFTMESFGQKIRKLREEKKLPLHKVADYLEIDQAILSKIEREKRNANRKLVLKFASYFEFSEEELLISWLSDKILYNLEEEDLAKEALQLAEEKIVYKSFQKIDKKLVITTINNIVGKFKTIQKAWLFGSFVRGDDKPQSDIDIAIKKEENFSYFDLAEIKNDLENQLKRKVDIGFIDSFKPYILKHIKPDLKLIYEKQV
jgi:predicted nucleotidyltransferase